MSHLGRLTVGSLLAMALARVGVVGPTRMGKAPRNAIRPTVAGPATGTLCRPGLLPLEVEVLRPVGRAGEGLLQLAGPLRGVERPDRRPLRACEKIG